MPLLPIALFLLALAALIGVAGGVGFTVWFGGTWLRFYGYHRHKGLQTPDGATWGDRVRAWMREAAAIANLLLFKAELGPRALPRPGDARPPVLCIHGFTQDRTNFSAIRGTLWRAGRSSIAVDLGLPGRAPTRYAPALADRLADLWRAWPDGPVDLICHSMGGLLLREVLAARPELCARVGTVLTLGSPHGGTAASRGPLRLWPEGAGLHRRSPWIEALPTLRVLAPQARVITVAGTADYVVYPVETCHLAGSEPITLPGVGHAGLLIDERVLALVERTFTPIRSAP